MFISTYWRPITVIWHDSSPFGPDLAAALSPSSPLLPSLSSRHATAFALRHTTLPMDSRWLTSLVDHNANVLIDLNPHATPEIRSYFLRETLLSYQ